jgi:large subunit ribosomal protein L5
MPFNEVIIFTFAQIRDFRGLSLSFDKAGNYTFGLKEQLIFPDSIMKRLIKSRFTINIILEHSHQSIIQIYG